MKSCQLLHSCSKNVFRKHSNSCITASRTPSKNVVDIRLLSGREKLLYSDPSRQALSSGERACIIASHTRTMADRPLAVGRSMTSSVKPEVGLHKVVNRRQKSINPTGNMRKNLVKFGYAVPRISSRRQTDHKQTNRHADRNTPFSRYCRNRLLASCSYC